jgi:hypothetical protein
MRQTNRRILGALGLLLGLTACDTFDRLLTVRSPSRLDEANFLVPANAALISGSAVADFECAFGGYVVASGLAAGELYDGSQTAARWSYDRRDVEANQALYASTGCAGIGVYTPLNVARFTNDQAVTLISGWTDAQVPDRQTLLARNSAMAGYAMLLLGEGFCECVVNVGPLLTPLAAFDSAEVRFTAALTAAQAAGDAALTNLALVGRARARFNAGDNVGATADAVLVPQDFVYNATADANSGVRNNRIYAQNNQGRAVTVAPAYRNMMVDGNPDPRVQAQASTPTLMPDQVNDYFIQLKYADLIAPTPIATGIEAALIRAEIAGPGTGVGIINTLRARPGVALPALTPAEEAAFAATVAEERRRELWLQGTRWFDMNRLSLTQEPAVGGPYPKGGLYGNQRCWPLPDVERLANPNL